jgi:hypothetical protein
LVVTGLRANSEYRFTIQARNNLIDLWSEHSSTLFAKTTSHAPSALRLRSNILETTSVELAWSLPDPPQGNATIYGYVVYFRSLQPTLGVQSGTQLCSAGKTGGGCRVNGLSPGSRYDFAVATCTDAELVASVGPKTKAITASTATMLPKIWQPQVTELQEDSSVVSWTCDTGGLPILSAILYSKLEGEALKEEQVVSLSRQNPNVGALQKVKVRGLGPALEYRFLIKASNALGTSESTLSEPVLTLPAPVCTPTVVRVSTRTVLVRWTLWSGRRTSKGHRLRVKSAPTAAAIASAALSSFSASPSSATGAYEISQRLIRQAPWIDAGLVGGSSSEYEVKGLEGSRQVQVQVAAENEAGWGGWSLAAATETQPTAPSLVFIREVYAEEVVLKWSPPPGARLQYQILPLLRENDAWVPQALVLKDGGEVDTHRVGPLLKGREYTFQVAVREDKSGATSEEGGAGDYSAVSNSVRTLSTVPTYGPPLEADAAPGSVTATSLRLRWKPAMELQQAGGADIKAFEVQARKAEHGWAAPLSQTVKREVSEWQALTITGLDANTKYVFRLVSENSVGSSAPGPQSSELITLPPPLPPPRMIAALDSIVLTWVPGNLGYEAFEIQVTQFIALSQQWSPWSSIFGGKGEASLLLSPLLLDTRYRSRPK